MVKISSSNLPEEMWPLKSVSKLGLALFLPLNILSSNSIAQIKVYNANEMHELDSENQLAAKKIYYNKKQSCLDESTRSIMIT